MKNLSVLALFFFVLTIALTAGPGDIIKQMASPSAWTTGMAFDGKTLWTVDRNTDKLYQIDAASGKVLASLTAPGYFCTGLAWDGRYLWVADMDFTNTSTESYSGKIYQLDVQSGRTLKVIMAPASDPQGLAWTAPICGWPTMEPTSCTRSVPMTGPPSTRSRRRRQIPGG